MQFTAMTAHPEMDYLHYVIIAKRCTEWKRIILPFLAYRTNGRAIATLLRLSSSSSSVVCRLW